MLGFSASRPPPARRAILGEAAAQLATPSARPQPRGALPPRAAAAAAEDVAAAGGDADGRARAVRAEVTRRIKALGRAGKAREAVGELAGMARLGVQPDTQSATALVDACMRGGRIEMGEQVFEELFGGLGEEAAASAAPGLLTPDEVTFCVLVRAYGDASPPRWSAISEALTAMERRHGIPPGVRTFNALLGVCARASDEARGAEVIARMAASNVQPDSFSLEAVQQRKSLRSLLRRTFQI
jgi:pentatricopeptide repeat protein